jgi:hypothetical protein
MSPGAHERAPRLPQQYVFATMRLLSGPDVAREDTMYHAHWLQHKEFRTALEAGSITPGARDPGGFVEAQDAAIRTGVGDGAGRGPGRSPQLPSEVVTR